MPKSCSAPLNKCGAVVLGVAKPVGKARGLRRKAAFARTHVRTPAHPHARTWYPHARKTDSSAWARLWLGSENISRTLARASTHLVLAHQGPHHSQEDVHGDGGEGRRKRPRSNRVNHLAPVGDVRRNLVAPQPGETVIRDDVFLAAGAATIGDDSFV